MRYYSVPNEIVPFFNGKTDIRDLKYTKIKITGPSKYLTQDLWIENYAPKHVIIEDTIIRWGEEGKLWIPRIILFAIISCLASLFAGIIIFWDHRPSKKKLALFGLWNFLTIIGFAIATVMVFSLLLS